MAGDFDGHLKTLDMLITDPFASYPRPFHILPDYYSAPPVFAPATNSRSFLVQTLLNE